MKRFLLLFLFLPSSFAVAQSLQLTGEASHSHTSQINTWITSPLTIKNTSSKPVRVAVRRVADQIDQDQSAMLCLDGECTIGDQALELTTLLPSESEEDIIVRFNTGFVPRNSTIKYFVYDIDNPQDGVYHALTYRVFDNFPHGILFSQGKLKVGNAYPNPATDRATIDYSLVPTIESAQIAVHNVLGNQVIRKTLEAGKTSLALPIERLSNGVYFYSLYLDGKGVITKKFVIRK